MVSIEEIQAAYYMVAASGVLVAAVFYIMNLKEQRRNMRLTLESRRIGTVLEITGRMADVDTTQTFFELMNWEWNNYDDFYRKYGSNNNAEAAGKMYTMFNRYNANGALLRKGMVNIEDLYDSASQSVIWLWEKYKPIIEEVRRRYNGQHYMRDFEYHAGEMIKYVNTLDPSYKVPEALLKYIPDN